MNKLRIISGLLSFCWLVISLIIWNEPNLSELLAIKIIATLTTLVFAIYAIRGASKLTSIAGKILIAMSILTLIAQLISNNLDFININTLILTLSLISGLLLEKVSPHQQIYSWMFLMIATKVELILIGVLVTLINETDPIVQITPFYWWAIIPLMLIGVIFLITKKQAFYRAIILFTTLYTLTLTIIFIFISPNLITSLIATCVALWPIATERLIGFRVYIKNKV